MQLFVPSLIALAAALLLAGCNDQSAIENGQREIQNKLNELDGKLNGLEKKIVADDDQLRSLSAAITGEKTRSTLYSVYDTNQNKTIARIWSQRPINVNEGICIGDDVWLVESLLSFAASHTGVADASGDFVNQVQLNVKFVKKVQTSPAVQDSAPLKRAP
jgi:hypothetical protein